MQLLALMYGVFIGIGLITGVLHLFVGLRRRPHDRVHLSFAAMTLLIAAVVLAESGYRFATNVGYALRLLNWGIGLTALALIALIWFVAFYTKLVARWFLYAMTLLFLLAAAGSLLLPTGILYAGDIQFKSFTTAWGESFLQISGTPSNWQTYNIMIFLVTFVYIFAAIWRQYRSGDHRAALTLLAGMCFVVAGTIYDFLIDFGVIAGSVGLYPISYLGLIMVMSLGLADDVVRTGRVQSELLENERRWRTLLAGIEEVVVGLDDEGRIEYVNPYFAHATGYEPDEVLGKDWIQLMIPKADRPDLEQTFAEVLQNNFHRHHRNNILTRNDEARTISWSNVRLRDAQGAIIGSLSVGRDITEQLAAQAALERHQLELEDLVTERTIELQTANLELDGQHQAAERRRRTAEGFASILAALNTNRPMNDIMAFLTVHADRLMGCDASVVVNQVTSDWQIVASTVPDELGASMVQLSAATMMHAAEAGKPVGYSTAHLLAEYAGPDVGANENGDTLAETNGPYDSVMTIPLAPQDRPEWGILLCYVDEQAFSQEDLDNATILQGQVQLAIENTQLRGRMADQAVARERIRLSRDLHDSVTQNLYTISTLAEAMPDLVESHPAELAGAAANLRLLAAGALAEMRTLLLELRPAVLLEKSLGELLQQLVDGLQSRTHTQIIASVMNDRVFPADVQVALYRIAQEALNNVIKHAAAEHAVVGLYCDGGRATLRIWDDGCGFNPEVHAAGGFGLNNLRERAQQLNGTFDLTTTPDQGTEIVVIWNDQGQEHNGNNDRCHAGAESRDPRAERG
jgi:PAS domain S-box-containing protein